MKFAIIVCIVFSTIILLNNYLITTKQYAKAKVKEFEGTLDEKLGLFFTDIREYRKTVPNDSATATVLDRLLSCKHKTLEEKKKTEQIFDDFMKGRVLLGPENAAIKPEEIMSEESLLWLCENVERIEEEREEARRDVEHYNRIIKRLPLVIIAKFITNSKPIEAIL